MHATLTEARLREQIGGRYDVCFQETKVTDAPFDKSIKQGGKVSPSLFDMMVKSIFVVLQESWRRKGYGLKLEVAQDGRGGEKVTNVTFADNVFLFLREGRNSMR